MRQIKHLAIFPYSGRYKPFISLFVNKIECFNRRKYTSIKKVSVFKKAGQKRDKFFAPPFYL